MLKKKSWIKNFLSLSVLFSFALVFTQCDPPEISDPATTNKTDSTKSNYATLVITNSKEQDPGDIFVYYFDQTSADILNAKSNLIGKISYQKTATFTIPAGTWKFGFGSAVGTIYGLIKDNGTSGAQDWLAYPLDPKTSYTLTLLTNGNRTEWLGSYDK